MAAVHTLELQPALTPTGVVVEYAQYPTAVVHKAEATPTLPAPPSPSPLPTVVAASVNAGSTAAPASTPTPTPAPTYTPPPPPPIAEWEHFRFRRPVPNGSAVWTDKVYPYGGTRGGTLPPHHGVEFYVPMGTDVLAVDDGIVRFAGSDASVALGPQPDFYGNAIVIESAAPHDGRPLYTLYGHLSEVFVDEGRPVSAGQLIGRSGDSGVAVGPHLHFEVRLGQNDYNATRNPRLWLIPLKGTGVVAGRILHAGGAPATEAAVFLNRVDGAAPYTETVTYAQSAVNPDDGWQENFVADDVEPGFYEVLVRAGSRDFKQQMWVYPNRANFVELTLE